MDIHIDFSLIPRPTIDSHIKLNDGVNDMTLITFVK